MKVLAGMVPPDDFVGESVYACLQGSHDPLAIFSVLEFWVLHPDLCFHFQMAFNVQAYIIIFPL